MTTDIAQHARDAYRFVSAYFSAMASTPHLYISAYSWPPARSWLTSLLPSHVPLPPVQEGRKQDWDPCLWSRRLSRGIHRVEFLPRGHRVLAVGRERAFFMDADTGKLLWNIFIPKEKTWRSRAGPSGRGRHVFTYDLEVFEGPVHLTLAQLSQARQQYFNIASFDRSHVYFWWKERKSWL